MTKKDNKKRMYLIGIMGLFVVVVLFVNASDEDTTQQQASCIAHGGEWKTMGLVGCCQDDAYWIEQSKNCIASGGNWNWFGTKGICNCPDGKQLICPHGSPCAMCYCQG